MARGQEETGLDEEMKEAREGAGGPAGKGKERERVALARTKRSKHGCARHGPNCKHGHGHGHEHGHGEHRP